MRSPTQGVMVTQAVPSNDHSDHVHRVDPNLQVHTVRFPYPLQRIFPSVNDPAGDTIFDPALGMLPRWALATYFLCGGAMVFTNIDILCHVATLIGRVVRQQPAW